MQKQPVFFRDLGVMGYTEAWEYQEWLLKQNVDIKTRYHSAQQKQQKNATTNYLLFVEHPPVYTLGKTGHEENVLLDEEELQDRGILFVKTNRGGDITFHGPEQIVGYPILDLEKFGTDIGKYLRNLEEVIIRTLAEYGIREKDQAGKPASGWNLERKAGKGKLLLSAFAAAGGSPCMDLHSISTQTCNILMGLFPVASKINKLLPWPAN